MLNIFLIIFGKILSNFFRLLNLGDGSTWPGHIALNLNKKFIRQVSEKSKTKIIIVAGTNGKTTTSSLIKHALEKNDHSVIQNRSGANLLNGIASTFITNVNTSGKLTADYAILEIDENTLPLILKEVKADFVVLLNLFRDQLDRYGEVNIVASYWAEAIQDLTKHTTLILNADDPQIAYLSKETDANALYFGLKEKNNLQIENNNDHASDSGYCPKCNNKLTYTQIIFSHLGDWKCGQCGLERPPLDIQNAFNPLPGVYNQYNALAATLVLKQIGIRDKEIEQLFTDFHPAFGRQEIVNYKDKKVQIFLSKNPTSFNQSFRTISELGATTVLIVLNDRVPDGKDVSWIWDIDLSGIKKYTNIFVSGDRVYDMALRLKYEFSASNPNSKLHIFESLQQAIDESAKILGKNQTLYVLPTYSAMLDVRKILTGKKIL